MAREAGREGVGGGREEREDRVCERVEVESVPPARALGSGGAQGDPQNPQSYIDFVGFFLLSQGAILVSAVPTAALGARVVPPCAFYP